MQLSYETLLGPCANGGAMHKPQQGPRRRRVFPGPVAAWLQPDELGRLRGRGGQSAKWLRFSRRFGHGSKCRWRSGTRAGGSSQAGVGGARNMRRRFASMSGDRRSMRASILALAPLPSLCAGRAAGGLWGPDLISFPRWAPESRDVLCTWDESRPS